MLMVMPPFFSIAIHFVGLIVLCLCGSVKDNTFAVVTSATKVKIGEVATINLSAIYTCYRCLARITTL